MRFFVYLFMCYGGRGEKGRFIGFVRVLTRLVNNEDSLSCRESSSGLG